jgi:hypothetical protein
VNFGGREGFIPAPGELVSKGLFELAEYPYLRKYLARKLHAIALRGLQSAISDNPYHLRALANIHAFVGT